MLTEIYPHRSDSHHRLPVRHTLAAPEHAAYPRNELTWREGLGHVVIGAELEADDAIDLVVARSHEQDRGPVVLGAHPAAQFDAVDAGQSDIQDHRRRLQSAHRVQAAEPVAL